MKEIIFLAFIILSLDVYADGAIYYPNTPTGLDVSQKINQALKELPTNLTQCVGDIHISAKNKIIGGNVAYNIGGMASSDGTVVIFYNEGDKLEHINLLGTLAHEAMHACKNRKHFSLEEQQKIDEFNNANKEISEVAFNHWRDWINEQGLSFEEFKQLPILERESYKQRYYEENIEFLKSLEVSEKLKRDYYYILEVPSKITNEWKKCFMDASDRVVDKVYWNSTYLEKGVTKAGPAFGSPRPFSQSRKCGCEDTSDWIGMFYGAYGTGFYNLVELLNSTKTCTVYKNYPDDLTLIEENCCAIAKAKLQLIVDYGWIPTDSSRYQELKQLADKCQPKTIPCGGTDNSGTGSGDSSRRIKAKETLAIDQTSLVEDINKGFEIGECQDPDDSDEFTPTLTLLKLYNNQGGKEYKIPDQCVNERAVMEVVCSTRAAEKRKDMLKFRTMPAQLPIKIKLDCPENTRCQIIQDPTGYDLSACARIIPEQRRIQRDNTRPTTNY